MTDRLRDLFGVPPGEFVAARDALAKELRAGGRETEAKEVASLRRPTAPVWAVNQLARRAPAEVEELLDSSERVQKAQLRGAGGDELRAAMAGQRAALAKLERGAEQVLRGAGLQASPGRSGRCSPRCKPRRPARARCASGCGTGRCGRPWNRPGSTRC